MKTIKFRDLRADEVDCRVSTCKSTGCTLLLYKDARCDMNILDETLGVTGWKRHHEVVNGNLFCTVEIWDEEKKEWISKQDVGVESYAEKEKGQASDSFKRACFNLGIGRELYTAPFIWISPGKVSMTKRGEKYVTYDRFKIVEMDVIDKRITSLVICNEKTGEIAYRWMEDPSEKEGSKESDSASDQRINTAKQKALLDFCDDAGLDIHKILKSYQLSGIDEITERQHLAIITYGAGHKKEWGAD